MRVGELSYTTGYPGYPFKGCIDEVELFNRKLDPLEIKALYDARSAGKCKTNAPCQPCPPLNQTVTGCPPVMPDYSTFNYCSPPNGR